MPFLQTLGGGSAQGFKDTSGGGGDNEWVDGSGGTETTSGDYKIHDFTSDGTFTLNAVPSDLSGFIELFMIAGGGGGGGRAGAGGGAGGVIWKRAQVVQQTGAIAIVIGQGGNGGPSDSYGAAGGNTTFNGAGINLSAQGGGGAPGGQCDQGGNSGGSGAGGTYGGKGGSWTAGQGSHGGDSGGHHGGQGCSGGSYAYKEGGGGGYLGIGESGNINNGKGRQGGAGAYFSISGSQVGYAGGGDAGGHTPWNGGVTNLNAFAAGDAGGPGSRDGGDATDGRGGGGGGASSDGGGSNSGGDGGNGRVIIRYRIQNTTGNEVAGFTKSAPARYADDMLAWDPNIANGVYWLGNDDTDARQVFCIFNPNGANSGGWMAVMTIGRQSDTGGSPNLCTANAVGTFPTDNPYIVGSVSQTKMSDTDIDFLTKNHGGSHPYKILCDTWNWDGDASDQGNAGESNWKGNRSSPNGPGDMAAYPITTFPWPGSVIAAPDCVQVLPQRSVQKQWLRNTWLFDSNRKIDPSGGGTFGNGNTSTRVNANSRANIAVLQTANNNEFQFVDANNAGACNDNDHKSYILNFRKCGVSSAAAYSSLCDDNHTGWYSHSTQYNCYHGYNVVYVR